MLLKAQFHNNVSNLVKRLTTLFSENSSLFQKDFTCQHKKCVFTRLNHLVASNSMKPRSKLHIDIFTIFIIYALKRIMVGIERFEGFCTRSTKNQVICTENSGYDTELGDISSILFPPCKQEGRHCAKRHAFPNAVLREASLYGNFVTQKFDTFKAWIIAGKHQLILLMISHPVQ